MLCYALLGSEGYLERAGFYKCLPDANPLALYAGD